MNQEISKMKKAELIKFISEIYKEHTKIDEMQKKAKKIASDMEGYHHTVTNQNGGGLLENIKNAHTNSEEKYSKIEEIYNRLEKLTIEENEDGTIENRIKTYDEELTELKENLPVYEEKHRELYSKIEKELNAGATTVKLAKNFNSRYEIYKKSRTIKEIGLVLAFLSIPFYLILSNLIEPITVNNIGIRTIINFPIFAFITWFIIFLTNRRAEDKKIEELYNHKAALAQSYVGYKEHIKDLEKNIGEDDKELLNNHMKNLLETINKNPSDFLKSKGEGHPIREVIGSKNNND